jgi:hypothetical protein
MKRIIILTLSVALTGCGEERRAGLPTFDIETAIESPKTFDLAEIAQSIEFIPLDDSQNEALIDANIRGLEESKDGFYLQDGMDRPVKVFDRAGKFLSTRGVFGRGPDDILDILDMAVDHQTGNVWLYSQFNRRITTFDATGRVSAKLDDMRKFEMASREGKLMLLRNPDINFAAMNPEPETGPGKTITVLEVFSPDLQREGSVEGPDRGTNAVFTRFSDSGQPTSAAINPQIITDNGVDLLIKEGRCDTVFHYNGETNSLEPAYRLDMGKYTLPAGAYGLGATVRMDKYYRIFDVFEGDRHVVVSIFNDSSDGRSEFLVFEGDGDSKGFSATGPDGTPGIFLDGIRFTPEYVRDNRLVGYMRALDIVDSAATLTNPDLKAIAATLKEESNPVIVVAKLK